MHDERLIMGSRMISEKDIGKNIKEIRSELGLTLEVLAQHTGFSKGYLSKVENSDKAPPVSTLIRVAQALNISISRLLGENEKHNPVSLVKKKERQHLARNGTVFGYSYQTLAHSFVDKHIQPYILIIPPTTKKPRKSGFFQHEGEEMLYILSGTLKMYIGDDIYIAEEGDCLYFDSSIPHFGISNNDRNVKCLITMIDPNSVPT